MDISMLIAVIGIVIFIAIGISVIFFTGKDRQELPARSQGTIPQIPSLNQQVKSQCPSCQKPIEWNDACFCSACGTDLNPQCSQCNIPLRTGDAFCYKCGQSITKNTPPILSSISQSSIPATVKGNISCPYCNATTTTQDTFCGSCGKSLITNTDQTMQK
jgi:hypothetical protein